MQAFVQRFAGLVLGVLLGFDRWRFRGSKRRLCYPQGVLSYLSYASVLLKDFNKPFAKDLTATLCQAIEKPATQAGLYRYLNNSAISKEATALSLAAQHQKTQGLIAVLGCVEPCQNMRVRKNPKTKMLEVRRERGKCLHYYHYFLDPDFGLRYTRLQSWFPFTMHVGLNGRDWLAQQLLKAGINFVKKDNCFPWIEDFAKAQALLDEQLQTGWQPLLERWTRESCPTLETLLKGTVPYYWSVQEAEFATDIAFRSPEDLARLYPTWVQHAYASLHGRDLLQFMNYRWRTTGTPRATGEVQTTVKELVEGTCVRHRVKGNLLKMYDKQASMLRVETALADLEHFKVFRTKEGDEGGEMSYRRLRKGVADLHRRAEVSAKINDRYLGSLATVQEKQTLAEVTKALGQRVSYHGRMMRALNPLAPQDASLLAAVSQGKFMIDGFSNRQVREILFPTSASADPAEQKRLSAKVTRLLQMLRAHGLIKRVQKTHRYLVTSTGQTQLSVLLAAGQANAQQLLHAA
jgi:hypothetical protein